MNIPIISLLQSNPIAVAVMNGSSKYPDIYGLVRFYQTNDGVIVFAEIKGLPENNILGFHIHSGTSCSGNTEDEFADAMSHYNPDNREHPYHSGDLPPLFSNNGKALSIFLTDRFTVDDIIEKIVIIHSKPDDFKTQPSGDSGIKIACGIIGKVER